MSHKEEADVNEEFENLLFAEENAQHLGYQEGYEVGKEQLVNGFHLGYHRASLLGSQLGYYSGVLEQFLSANKCTTDKGVCMARELLEDIYNFPKCNDESIDLLNAIDNIKFKYAKFCSVAKVHLPYPKANKLDF